MEANLKPELLGVLRSSQPHAVLFNFPKAPAATGPQRNSGRWFGGNDCYNVEGPVWSTYCCDNRTNGCIAQTSPVCSLNNHGHQSCHLKGSFGCVPTGLSADVGCNTFLPAAHEAR